MDERLPAEQGQLRPDLSDLAPDDVWHVSAGDDGAPEPERPETD